MINQSINPSVVLGSPPSPRHGSPGRSPSPSDSACRWQSRQRWARPLAAVQPRLMDCSWRFTRPSWKSPLAAGRSAGGQLGLAAAAMQPSVDLVQLMSQQQASLKHQKLSLKHQKNTVALSLSLSPSAALSTINLLSININHYHHSSSSTINSAISRW